MGISERDLEVLSFEEKWRRHSGAKDQAMREKFGWNPTRYYQRLNVIMKDPAALAAKPMLVNSLLRAARAREARRRSRELP